MYLGITPTVAHWSPDNQAFSLVFDENPLTEFVELPDAHAIEDEDGWTGEPDPAWKEGGKEADEELDGSRPARRPRLYYSNIMCGVLRGALEMVRCQVEVKWVSDQLLGDESTEMRVKLLQMLDVTAPDEDS